MLKLIEGNFDHSEVNKLLNKHFIELRAASPEGSAHVLDIAGLMVPSIKFWSLWENNQLMGCGALKFIDKDHGEFKSIRIHDEFRGKGFGTRIINHLINEAKNLNIKRISIETGDDQASKLREPTENKNVIQTNAIAKWYGRSPKCWSMLQGRLMRAILS